VRSPLFIQTSRRVPLIGNENGVTVTLPTPKPVAALKPAEINPGLAPDMNASPHGQ
jgi:hypothetical protein